MKTDALEKCQQKCYIYSMYLSSLTDPRCNNDIFHNINTIPNSHKFNHCNFSYKYN